jgi:prepilin-type N-terminal cleavage/methylation domain-containing protein
LLARRRLKRLNEDEAGFTLLELSVVLSIMTVVVVIAGGALLSLSTAASRTDSMVNEEQMATNTLAQLSRDLRSAHTISFPASNLPSGGTPGYDIQLAVNQPTGGTVAVLWAYSSNTATLSREVQVGSVFKSSGPALPHVANGSTPIFTYYYTTGSQITSAVPATIATCASRVGVELYVSSSTSGSGTFHTSDNVAITDQLNQLTAPGVQPCTNV